MADVACTHPARVMGKGGRLVCLTCGAEIPDKPEKPAKPAKQAEGVGSRE